MSGESLQHKQLQDHSHACMLGWNDWRLDHALIISCLPSGEKKMCIQHVKILQGKRPVFLVSSWHSLEHEMPSRSQWFGPRYKPPACYSELYSVCPRGQLRHVCSEPAADVGGETQKAKNNRRAYREGREKRNKRWNDFLHSSCLRLRRIMVCECVHQDATLGRHRISESLENNKTSRNRRCSNLNIGVQRGADKKKGWSYLLTLVS